MAFRVDPNPVFWAPVKVREPGEDAVQEFRARFRALTVEEFNGFDLGTEEGVRDFLDDALLQADELEDRSGEPIAWDDRVKAVLVNIPHVRAALVTAYVRAVGEASRGN